MESNYAHYILLVGVIVVGVLFAMASVLPARPDAPPLLLAAQTLGGSLLTLGVFAGGCVLFSRYAEEHITMFVERIQNGEGTIIVILALMALLAPLTARPLLHQQLINAERIQ